MNMSEMSIDEITADKLVPSCFTMNYRSHQLISSVSLKTRFSLKSEWHLNINKQNVEISINDAICAFMKSYHFPIHNLYQFDFQTKTDKCPICTLIYFLVAWVT